MLGVPSLPIWGWLQGWYAAMPPHEKMFWVLLTLSIAIVLFVCIIKLVDFIDEQFSSRPIPLLDVINKSTKYGWKILEDNYDILDLLDALRAYGRDGYVIFRGKTSSYSDIITINQPAVEIPKEHWDTFWIDWSHLYKHDGAKILGFQGENFRIQSYEMGSSKVGYKDLHLVVSNLGKYLKRAKKEFGGRRERQEAEQKKRREELMVSIQGQDNDREQGQSGEGRAPEENASRGNGVRFD